MRKGTASLQSMYRPRHGLNYKRGCCVQCKCHAILDKKLEYLLIFISVGGSCNQHSSAAGDNFVNYIKEEVL